MFMLLKAKINKIQKLASKVFFAKLFQATSTLVQIVKSGKEAKCEIALFHLNCNQLASLLITLFSQEGRKEDLLFK